MELRKAVQLLTGGVARLAVAGVSQKVAILDLSTIGARIVSALGATVGASVTIDFGVGVMTPKVTWARPTAPASNSW